MRALYILLVTLLILPACSMRVPGFLGRGGDGDGTFSLQSDELPDPVSLPFAEATVRPALRGVILQVSAPAPSQGYHSAHLSTANGSRPDTSGILTAQFVATPPQEPQPIGPAATRQLEAGLFIPDRHLVEIVEIQVIGGGQSRRFQPR